MAVLAGIDEAGFGPSLGPLVVSGVTFRVPDDQLGVCLWDTLRATCARRATPSARKLLIADSKQVYRSRTSLAPLERPALVMLSVAGHRPASWRALLDLVACGATGELAGYPWYADADPCLPLCDGVGDIGTQANAVRRDCREQSVEFVGALTEPLLAGSFNRLVRSTRNKAVVLLGVVLRVADRILKGVADRHVRLCVDRLGGRMRYRESLSAAWPDCDLEILEESADRSAYRLVRPARVCEIEFLTDGDARRFPVALASLYSKYVRELYMHVFNRFWSGKQAGLKPTAGYYTDAQRWLGETASLLDRLSVDRSLLIRQR